MKKVLSFAVAFGMLLCTSGCITGVAVQTDYGAFAINDKNEITAEIEYEGATIHIEDNKVVAVELPNVILETE